MFSNVLMSTVSASEVMSPAVVTISESGETRVRVSWGPLQPESVTSYFIEYSALPSGMLRTTTVGRNQNSTLLTNLQPDTTYLVTVTARHASGKEKAMSVKVCTKEGELCARKTFRLGEWRSISCTLILTVLHSQSFLDLKFQIITRGFTQDPGRFKREL